MNNNDKNKNKIKIKVVLMGDSQVGKTCFFNYLEGNKFKQNHIATIGFENLRKFYNYTIDNINYLVDLNFYDTTGQERYRALTNSYFKNVDGIIFMYDVTEKKSLININNWVEEMKSKNNSKKLTCAVVGNKIDLFDEPQEEVYKNEIVDEDLKNIEKIFEEDNIFVMFNKVSAKKGTNIDDFMNVYIKQVAINKLEILKEKNDDINNNVNNRIIIAQNPKKKKKFFENCC